MKTLTAAIILSIASSLSFAGGWDDINEPVKLPGDPVIVCTDNGCTTVTTY